MLHQPDPSKKPDMLEGIIAIRRQGIYFAMITLALSQMFYFFCLQAPFTHGEDGIQGVPRGHLFGLIDLSSTTTMYYFVLVVVLLVGLLLTELLMFFFTSHLHVYFMVSKLISSILVFFWNFLARKFILYPGKIHEKV